MSLEKTSNFYDIRGKAAIKSQFGLYGSQSFPVHLSHPYRWYEQQLEKLGSGKGKRFLDLCCGTGIHSIYPAKLGYQVTGIDISDCSISAAIELSKKYNLQSKCTFKMGNALELIEKEDDFDIIFMSGSLYYFDLDVIVPIISKHLKKGGHFFCIETNGDNPIMNRLRKYKSARIKNHRDDRTLNNLLTTGDIKSFPGELPVQEVYYADFFALFGTIVKKIRLLSKSYHLVASALDHLILNKLGLKKLSFKFVLHGIKEID